MAMMPNAFVICIVCALEIMSSLAADFTRTNQALLTTIPTKGIVKGVAVRDINGDGNADVVLCSNRDAPVRILLNDAGTGEFSVGDGLPEGFACSAVVAADLDNDGNADLVWTLTEPNGSCGVLLNDGTGTFSAVTGAVPDCPAWAGSPGVGDINNDGILDLVIPSMNAYEPNQPNIPTVVYAGQGNGSFTVLPGTGVEDSLYPCGATIVDFDDDGVQDIIVLGCNEVGEDEEGFTYPTTPLYFYRNTLGVTGVVGFTNVVEELTGQTEWPGYWFGVSVCDLNNDGMIDFYFGNVGCLGEEGSGCHSENRPLLFMNNGNGTYTEASIAAGVAYDRLNWGNTCFDHDNDGHQDLVTVGGAEFLLKAELAGIDAFSPGIVFKNTGRFPLELTNNHGIMVGSGLARGDLNHDGLEELVYQQTAYLLPNGSYFGEDEAVIIQYNTTSVNHHWLKVRLFGTTNNRDGIGAKVTVEFVARNDTKKQSKIVVAGSSSQSSHDNVLTFGLGLNGQAGMITVVWPGHMVQSVQVPGPIRYNKLLNITEAKEKDANTKQGWEI